MLLPPALLSALFSALHIFVIVTDRDLQGRSDDFDGYVSKMVLLRSLEFAVTEILALVGALAYLHLVARRRGVVSRNECLLLGAGLAAALAPAFAALRIGLIWWKYHALWTPYWPGLLITSLLYLPLGLLCGWAFWRISIRPAVVPASGSFEIFD